MPFMFRLTATLVALLGVCAVTAIRADDNDEKEKIAKAQRKAADDLWKPFLSGKTPNSHETPTFLLVGSADTKELDKLGTAAEKAFASIKKTLQIKDSDRLWEGRLTIHVCKDRNDFRSLFGKLKKERPVNDETACFGNEADQFYILLG